MAAIVLLMLHIFLLSDEDHWCLFYPESVCSAVVLLEVGSIVEVVEDGLDGGWIGEGAPLSLIDAQTGRNLPYLFSYMLPYIMLFVTFSIL